MEKKPKRGPVKPAPTPVLATKSKPKKKKRYYPSKPKKEKYDDTALTPEAASFVWQDTKPEKTWVQKIFGWLPFFKEK